MSFLAVDHEGNVRVYKNNIVKYIPKEEAFKIIPTDNKEECDAFKKEFFEIRNKI